MSSTIKNLHDVEDSAPRFGIDELQEARFATKDLEAEDTGLAYIHVKPGCRQPFAHRHEAAEEVYVVLEGAGRVKLDDAVHDLARHDAVRVAPKVARCFEAGPDGLTLLAVGPHHEGDGEIIKGDFWT